MGKKENWMGVHYILPQVYNAQSDPHSTAERSRSVPVTLSKQSDKYCWINIEFNCNDVEVSRYYLIIRDHYVAVNGVNVWMM